ncbi:MAG: PIG-L family deacetylase [Acidobacteria bacterium]|nr:PIG-L family deacetylase [Acidobacteriota bacterium]
MNLPVLVAAGLATALGLNALAQQQPASSRPQTLVAVFAHPDDETMAGPLLAHYGRQAGTAVHLVIVTNGEKGVMPHAGIPAGDELAKVRIEEAECAASALGAHRPMLLGFPDGGLTQAQALATIAGQLETALRDLAPDAIVTWGPDGGYGHADHRIVSALVTQIVQTGAATPNLYYAELPKSGLNPEFLASLRFPAPFRPVDDGFLNVRVPYTAEDLAVARRALGCHASQFTAQTMDTLMSLTQRVNNGVQYLRAWNGGPARSDLFGR